MVRPSPFTLTITDSSGTFTGSYPTLYGLALNGDTIYRFQSIFAGSTFSISGDSLKLQADNGTEGCLLSLGGTIAGSSGSGTAGFNGMCGPTTTPATGTATKF
jgi:hypothetical protein